MDVVLPRHPLSDPLRPQRFGLRLAPGAQVVRREQWLTWCDAEQAVAAARAEARQITGAARAAFEAECRRGHQEGVQQARQAQAEQMFEQVGRTIDFYGQVEDRMIGIVMQAVQQIVCGFDDRARAAAVVKGALQAVRNQKQVTVRVAPARVELLRASLDELLAAHPGIACLEVAADSRLAEDACIVDSELGVVEASIGTQLQALRAGFSRVLGGAPA